MSDMLEDLNRAVQKGDAEMARKLTGAAIDSGINPSEILEKSLRPAMEEVGRRFERLEVYLPEVMFAADAMTAAVEVLRPHLTSAESEVSESRILLGTVEGDVHDIGKNIVAIMLQGAGFNIIDLGSDVPVLTFVEKVKETGADILGMSALMTTTMFHMPRVISALEERDLRKSVKLIVGGAPVLREWAEQIGADGYGENALEAVQLARELAK